jgi:hypothetical protein
VLGSHEQTVPIVMASHESTAAPSDSLTVPIVVPIVPIVVPIVLGSHESTAAPSDSLTVPIVPNSYRAIVVTTVTRPGPNFPTAVPVEATVIYNIGVSLLQWKLLLLPLVLIFPF